MIFLSSQPDDFYFTWQLELQLYNFKSFGIEPLNIHMLIAYNPIKGLAKHFQDFIEQNKHKAQFFCYPDERADTTYISSIRPHIIKQHFKANTWLESATIFYHDSDVLFNTLPDFERLIKDDIWYTSDTRNYIDSKYIVRLSSEEFLRKMSDIVGLKVEKIKANDIHAGGAQYLIKNSNYTFWQKVEDDCVNLFKLMTNRNVAIADENCKTDPTFTRNQFTGIQAWCADMWAVLWNAWYFGKEVHITNELDFCWTRDASIGLSTKNLLHYAGKVEPEEKQFFRKQTYKLFNPYFEYKIEDLSSEYCGYKIKTIIQEITKDTKRYELSEITFIIKAEIESNVEDILDSVSFLLKHFETSIILYEIGEISKIERKYIPENVQLVLVSNDKEKSNRIALHINQNVTTDFICFYDPFYVLAPSQIIEAAEHLKENSSKWILPHSPNLYCVDALLKATFNRILDVDFLIQNSGKFLKVPIENHLFPMMFLPTNESSKLVDDSCKDDNLNEAIRLDAQFFCFSPALVE